MNAEMTRLGDVVTIVGGGTPSRKKPEYYNGNIPWITVKDFTDTFYISSSQERISQLGLDNSASRLIPAGNVILCTRMSVGKASINAMDVAINQDLKALFCNSKIDPKYLNYYLASVAPYLESQASGATVKGIIIDDIQALQVPLSGLSEQKKIVARLDQADRLCRLRRYALKISESFLQASFIQIFGDPYSLDKDVAVTGLEDIALINPSIDPRLNDIDEVSFIPMADVDEKTGQVAGNQVRSYGEVKRGYTCFEDGDVLFAKITPCMENGKSAIANGLRNGIGFGSTEWHVIRPTTKTNSEWLLGLVRLGSVRHRAAVRFVGSAGQQRVPEGYLSRLMVPVPRADDLEKYKMIMTRNNTLVKNNQESLRQAEHLFQSLLHQAFGGN